MNHIKTLGQLMTLALACSTAQAERLSLSQLKAMMDELQNNVERLEEQRNQPSLAGFSCPPGLAVTSFDAEGQPMCTSPWPDAQPGEPLPFNFTCEENYAKDFAEEEMEQAMSSLIQGLQDLDSLVFENTLATATLANINVVGFPPIEAITVLVENNANQPCDDAIHVTYVIEGLELEGDIEVVSNGISEFTSQFTLSIPVLSIDLNTLLRAPDPDNVTLPLAFGRDAIQTSLEAANTHNSDLSMSNMDDPVTINIMANLLANELAREIAEQSQPFTQQTLSFIPDPVVANLTEL